MKKLRIKKQVLRKHQRKVFYWAKDIEHPGFLLKMRLGKNRLTIKDVKRDQAFPCLAFMPYSGIYGFKEDLQVCGFDESEYVVLKGTKKQRKDSLLNILFGKKIFITNRECHLSIGKELAQYNWKSVILDESTCIKNPNTKISRFMTKNFRDVFRRYILTGTPMPDSLLDIFQQALFLNPKIFYETPTYYSFQTRYFVKTEYGWNAPNIHKKFIAKRLAEHCYTMNYKEAGIGNKRVYERKVFQLKKKTMKSYINFVKYFILKHDDTLYKVTDYAIAQIAPLRLLCSGFIKNEETQGFDFVDDSKMLLLEELLKVELKGSKIIVWCDFLIEMEYIQSITAKNIGITSTIINGTVKQSLRDHYIEQFQAGKLDMLIAHPKCFKYSTKLDKADTTIYVSSPLGGETREQTEARMRNPFLKQPDLIIDLVAEDTLEEKNLVSIRRKENRQMSMARLIKHFQRICNESKN